MTNGRTSCGRGSRGETNAVTVALASTRITHSEREHGRLVINVQCVQASSFTHLVESSLLAAASFMTAPRGSQGNAHQSHTQPWALVVRRVPPPL